MEVIVITDVMIVVIIMPHVIDLAVAIEETKLHIDEKVRELCRQYV